ncbi:hypothetical protein HPB50_011295 [Hyalomma asiaticum]|uniref:Uncharacterized protein n=1 Tax=Hyalomma asiaticum TaxID=266040 RepID=A0ACB7TEU4_HYAAI|nr:hypothetical protein HPB50_011295 [Hyalomma asiaticum]
MRRTSAAPPAAEGRDCMQPPRTDRTATEIRPRALSHAGEDENRLATRGRNPLGETTAASISAQGARDRHAETAMPVSGSAARQPVREALRRWNAAVRLVFGGNEDRERGRRSARTDRKAAAHF